MTDLNLLIIGAGAIGTYFGSSLLLNGQRAVFLDRQETADTLRTRGMKLILDGETHKIENPVIVESLPEALHLGPFDAALTAVKSFDTAELAGQLAEYRVKLPPILCMQNGVENEAVYQQALGEEKVIAGTLTSAVGKPELGTALVERLRGVGVADSHEVSQKLVDGFNQAGLQAGLFADADSMKWSKLLTNLQTNASSAILDMSPAEIYADQRLYELEARQIREALEVMRRLDVQVVDLPGVPVRLLALLMQYAPPRIGRMLAERFIGKGRGEKMPSFHIDLHAGRGKSEVGYLNGAVVRFGEKTGVKTPVNRTLDEILQGMTDRTIPLDTYGRKPEALLAKI